MICGHDRETLRRAIKLHELRENEQFAEFMTRTRGTGQQTHDAYEAACDPAKLATIIAELMREAGRTVRFYDQHEHTELGSQCGDMVWVDERYDPTMLRIHIELDVPPFECGNGIEMHQARAFTIALLNSPQVTAQDIERMIGEL